MPAVPSGLYFAEGFVIISIDLIELAAVCCRTSCASIIDGRPSINTVKLPLPLRLTFPSISTVTEGTFSSTSAALPETTVCI